jgi:molybdate/tungstate transport system substrate-binding protein
MKLITILSIALLAMLVSGACQRAARQGDATPQSITVFHAGSLSLPVKAITDSFKKSNPHFTVLTEAAGSLECARKITELNKACDVFLSADYQIIDELLIPTHASFNLLFASNSMVIAWLPHSRKSHEINASNWYSILLHPDIAFGRSDPDADPCGYRSLLLMQLAEKHYALPGLYERFLKKDRRFMRPKEVDLLALLETRSIDYIFIYKSVALQHDLRFLELPNEINLSEPSLNEHYATAKVKIRGKKPSEFIEKKGEAITYGLTFPKNGNNPDGAITFLRFFLEDEGGVSQLEKMGQKLLPPSLTPASQNAPDAVQKMLRPKAVEGGL